MLAKVLYEKFHVNPLELFCKLYMIGKHITNILTCKTVLHRKYLHGTFSSMGTNLLLKVL